MDSGGTIRRHLFLTYFGVGISLLWSHWVALSFMELLNPAFVILVVKITICVFPGIVGVYLLAVSEEKKRDLRNKLCNRLFGVSNAIPYPNFERTLLIIGILGLLLSGAAIWFFLISGMLGG
jgi:hypothetical protein